MNMEKRILDLIEKSENQVSGKEHIKRAEKMAEKFKHIEPETYSVPMEKFFGLPSFRNDSNA